MVKSWATWRRGLIGLVTLLSLLLCIVSLVGWVRSFWIADSYFWGTPGELEQLVYSSSGRAGFRKSEISWGVVRGRVREDGVWREANFRVVADVPPLQLDAGRRYQRRGRSWFETYLHDERGALGFVHSQRTTAGSNGAITHETHDAAPYWFLVLIFAIAPLLGASTWGQRRRRRRLGLCQQCGYDLRGNIGSCPRCGAVVDPGEEILASRIEKEFR